MIDPVAIPILTLGVVLTLIAGKGYFRKTSPDILARKSVTKHTWPYPILYKAVTFKEPNVAQEGRELIAA